MESNMGLVRDKLLDLINSDNLDPSLSYWCDILLFSEANKDSLNIQDMTMICVESERCRAYWNSNWKSTITIFRNGHEMEIDQIKPGLDIKKEEVGPNVYQLLDDKIEKERLINETKETARNIIREREPSLGLIPIPV